MHIKSKDSENGFTLLEITIVLIITGILLSLFASALLTFVKTNKIKTTEFRIEKIEEAILQYLEVNRKYPCPSPRTIAADNGDFGREVTVDCNTGAFAGTVRNNGVRIGAVPNRSLNLPDEFAFDSWGNRLTYAVTEVLATDNLFVPDGGVIRILDSAGNELVSPPSNPNSRAHYVIVSHGASGDGSFPFNGVSAPAIPCPNAGSLDGENCDNDNVFRSTILNSDSVSADFYDDYIEYAGQTQPVFEPVPVGAVMAFATSACPSGWSTYTPAQGAFIYGFDPTPNAHPLYVLDPDEVAVGRPNAGARRTITLNEDVEERNPGEDQAIIPPFVALLYCRKD